MPKKEGVITKEGLVKESFRNGLFKVETDEGKEVLANLSGKLRMHHIRVLVGDRVKMEFSLSDLTRGRIVYRLR